MPRAAVACTGTVWCPVAAQAQAVERPDDQAPPLGRGDVLRLAGDHE